MNNREKTIERYKRKQQQKRNIRYKYVKKAKYLAYYSDMQDIFFYATLPKEEFAKVANKKRISKEEVHARKVVCQNCVYNSWSIWLPKTSECMRDWFNIDENFIYAYDQWEDEYKCLENLENYNEYFGL